MSFPLPAPMRRALELAAERDLSGWCREVQRLLATLEDGALPSSDSAHGHRAAALLRAAVAYLEARADGLDPPAAAALARAGAPDLLDASG
jgi:hypothetical protein